MRAERWNLDRGNRAGAQVPQEIREKWAEAQKVAIDLRTELGRNPVNRDRALGLRAQHRAIMQEISDWRFTQMLDALTAR
jgi:DNA-directed RNA polymerase specialized sigma subunit